MQNSSYLLHPPDLNSVAAAAVIASQNRNRRRTRIKFDAEQINILESAFQKTHYPDVNIVDRLSDELNINPERVSVWFQNRRAKFKKEKHKHEPSRNNEEFSEKTKDVSLPITDADETSKCDDSKEEEEQNKMKTRIEKRPIKKTISRSNLEDKKIYQDQTVREQFLNREEDNREQNSQVQKQYDAFNTIFSHNNYYSNHVYPNYQLNGLAYPNFVYPYILDQKYYDNYTAHQKPEFATPAESKENSLTTNDSRSETPSSSEEYENKKENIVDGHNKSNESKHHLDDNNASTAEINNFKSEQNSEEKQDFYYDKTEESDENDESVEEDELSQTEIKPNNFGSSCDSHHANNYNNISAYSRQMYPNNASNELGHSTHSNFFHSYMLDPRYYEANQQLRAFNPNDNPNVPSPSSLDSRSNSPASSCDLKYEQPQYLHPNYSSIQPNTMSTEYNSIAYKPYSSFTGIFQPYADCHAESYNQSSFQTAYYKN